MSRCIKCNKILGYKKDKIKMRLNVVIKQQKPRVMKGFPSKTRGSVIPGT